VSLVLDIARGVLRRASKLPGLRQAERAWRWRQFQAEPNACWGVYGSFAEAEAHAPPTKPLGYDNEAAAGMYGGLLDTIGPKDYAVAFWLQRRLRPGGRVFDFGGHVGVKYYAIRTVLDLPEGVRWVVYDVPAVVARGRELARERGAPGLEFTDRFADASGSDVFLVLGSLQYVEAPLPERLATLPDLPEYVIVSSAPMVDGGGRYVTLQNIGVAYCPYLVEDRGGLVRGMAERGYALVRSWENPEKLCRILDQPGRSVEGYTSLHFAREGQRGAGGR
jgi:putative methyltransferase (TIGR04325 family)